ncbi:hypothetical protein D3C85_1426360 [compost metagenome]
MSDLLVLLPHPLFLQVTEYVVFPVHPFLAVVLPQSFVVRLYIALESQSNLENYGFVSLLPLTLNRLGVQSTV